MASSSHSNSAILASLISRSSSNVLISSSRPAYLFFSPCTISSALFANSALSFARLRFSVVRDRSLTERSLFALGDVSPSILACAEASWDSRCSMYRDCSTLSADKLECALALLLVCFANGEACNGWFFWFKEPSLSPPIDEEAHVAEGVHSLLLSSYHDISSSSSGLVFSSIEVESSKIRPNPSFGDDLFLLAEF